MGWYASDCGALRGLKYIFKKTRRSALIFGSPAMLYCNHQRELCCMEFSKQTKIIYVCINPHMWQGLHRRLKHPPCCRPILLQEWSEVSKSMFKQYFTFCDSAGLIWLFGFGDSYQSQLTVLHHCLRLRLHLTASPYLTDKVYHCVCVQTIDVTRHSDARVFPWCLLLVEGFMCKCWEQKWGTRDTLQKQGNPAVTCSKTIENKQNICYPLCQPGLMKQWGEKKWN